MQLRFLLAIILTASYLLHRSHMVQSRLVDTDQRIAGQVLGSWPLEGGARSSHPKSRMQPTSKGPKTGSGLSVEDNLLAHDEAPPVLASSPVHRHRHRHHLTTTAKPAISRTANAHTTRAFYLYNRCSGAHVQILGKRISALGERSNDYALMSLQSQTFGGPGKTHTGVTIQSKKAGVFLCFNKRGRLVTRFSGTSVNCLFAEKPSDNHYIKFESVYNPDWAIGFNRKGRPLAEEIASQSAPARRQKCYEFVKRPADALSTAA